LTEFHLDNPVALLFRGARTRKKPPMTVSMAVAFPVANGTHAEPGQQIIRALVPTLKMVNGREDLGTAEELDRLGETRICRSPISGRLPSWKRTPTFTALQCGARP